MAWKEGVNRCSNVRNGWEGLLVHFLHVEALSQRQERFNEQNITVITVHAHPQKNVAWKSKLSNHAPHMRQRTIRFLFYYLRPWHCLNNITREKLAVYNFSVRGQSNVINSFEQRLPVVVRGTGARNYKTRPRMYYYETLFPLIVHFIARHCCNAAK